MPKIDRILEDIIDEEIGDYDVAVLLSAGADSVSCAFAAQRIGCNITGYSFYVDGVETTDSRGAKEIADIFGWDFKAIDVPVENIVNELYTLVNQYDCIKKTQVECTWPFLYVYPEIEEYDVISGIAADGWFGSSKRACINFKEPKEKFDQFRNDYFGQKNIAGYNQQLQLANEYGKNFIAPYLDSAVENFMMQLDWYELNKPYHKAPVIDAFPEFQKIPKRRKAHENLQLVAGIDHHFEKLLDNPSVNKRQRKRVLDLVRDVVKERSTSSLTQFFNDE